MTKRKEGLSETAIEKFIRGLPAPVVSGLVLVLYPGIGLLLPLGLGLPTFYLIILNLATVVWAGALCLAWVGMTWEAVHRRHLVDWSTDLRRLNSTEFEWLVGEVFRREGWDVSETGRSDGADGNVDLRLKKDGRRAIVQCKRWQSWDVGVQQIREFLGTLVVEHLSPEDGVFVTLSRFTRQAREEARTAGLILIDGSSLESRIEKVRRVNPCPNCGRPMILDKSQRGWWLRCRVAGCSGKQDLSRDPAVAVELLMFPNTADPELRPTTTF